MRGGAVVRRNTPRVLCIIVVERAKPCYMSSIGTTLLPATFTVGDEFKVRLSEKFFSSSSSSKTNFPLGTHRAMATMYGFALYSMCSCSVCVLYLSSCDAQGSRVAWPMSLRRRNYGGKGFGVGGGVGAGRMGKTGRLRCISALLAVVLAWRLSAGVLLRADQQRMEMS